MHSQAVTRIVSYGQRYADENIAELKSNKNALQSNHWEALLYLFTKVFYQGRRDKTSEEVSKQAKRILSNHPEIQQGIWTEKTIQVIEKDLETCIGPGFVGKRGDIKMVSGILHYLMTLNDRNIVRHSIKIIEMEGFQVMSNELKSLYQIGDKIASFYLRDLIQIFDLKYDTEDAQYLQPVDTWVRKIALLLDISKEGDSDASIVKAMTSLCTEHGQSYLLFNQGIWYLGANSFTLLIEQLKALSE